MPAANCKRNALMCSSGNPLKIIVVGPAGFLEARLSVRNLYLFQNSKRGVMKLRRNHLCAIYRSLILLWPGGDVQAEQDTRVPPLSGTESNRAESNRSAPIFQGSL